MEPSAIIHEELCKLALSPVFCLGDVIFYESHSLFKKHNFGRDVQRFVDKSDWCVYNGKYHLNARGVISLGFYKKKKEVQEIVYLALGLEKCNTDLEICQYQPPQNKTFSKLPTVAREEPNLSFDVNPPQVSPTNKVEEKQNGKEKEKEKEKEVFQFFSNYEQPLQENTYPIHQHPVEYKPSFDVSHGYPQGNSYLPPQDPKYNQDVVYNPNDGYVLDNPFNPEYQEPEFAIPGDPYRPNIDDQEYKRLRRRSSSRSRSVSDMDYSMTDRSYGYVSDYESDFHLEGNDGFFMMMSEDLIIPQGKYKRNEFTGGYYSDVSSGSAMFEDTSLTSDFDDYHNAFIV
eukprot:TRINITY_DN7064_c0_g1_i1.p1 TRINITY_DN7064_c0_g1~~TRINITY_DN7064_c0_g1_i1.p1  ORF type:complete len:343 (-),score=75.15 TRINITY_DN7064_c0_g1_i1:83-1111(-)